jgi:urease accessory protein
MRAHARVVAEADPRRPYRLVEMTDSAPIGLRWTRDAIYLVGTAQSLLAEDELLLEVVVRKGATLCLRSAAASIAYASSNARLTVSCSVESGGVLDWQPEPLIATHRCNATVRAEIALANGAGLRWNEEVILGRYEEPAGDLDLTVSVDHDGGPLLRHQLLVGSAAPGWNGPATLAGHRAVGYRVIAGTCARPAAASGEGWAVLELDGPGAVITVVAHDQAELRRRLTLAEPTPAR